MQRLLGLDTQPVDAPGLTDELHRWVLGLPFVEELGPVRSAPHLRRFAVSCPPLNCYSVWLLTGGFEPETPERGVDIYAVLPQSTALLAAAEGWAMMGPDIHGVRRLVAMERPASPGELLGLEDVLMGAYLFAFPD